MPDCCIMGGGGVMFLFYIHCIDMRVEWILSSIAL